MSKDGFLVLLYQHLIQKFIKDRDLRAKNWLFVNVGSKILVHGPRRTPTNTDVIFEITADPRRKWIGIKKLKSGQTIDTDCKLLTTVIRDWATLAEIQIS